MGGAVVIMPGGHAGSVRSIEVDGQSVGLARAGDSADVSVSGVDAAAVAAGSVVCHPEFGVAMAARFEARVVVLDVPLPVLRGQQVCGSGLGVGEG